MQKRPQRNPKLVEAIEQSALTRKAYLFVLENGTLMPSHDFDHLYRVAQASLNIAYERGIRDVQRLQDVFIAGLFHDVIRTSEAITDKKGVEKSGELVKRFYRENKESRERGNHVSRMITAGHRERDGSILELADAAYFFSNPRILTFSQENTVLRELNPRKVSEVYRTKFGGKISKMPKPLKAWMTRLAREVGFEQSINVGLRAFSVRPGDRRKPMKNIAASARGQRLHATVDTMSEIALMNMTTNPTFSREIIAWLRKPEFYVKYGGADNLVREKVSSLTTMVESGGRPIILRRKIIHRLAGEIKSTMGPSFKMRRPRSTPSRKKLRI